MEEKDFKKLTDDVNESVNELTESIKAKADTATLELIKGELDDKIKELTVIDEKPIADYIKEVQDHANTLEEKMEKMVKTGQKGQSLDEQIDNLVKGEDYKNYAKKKKDGETAELVKVLTVASDLTAGTTSPVILPENIQGVTIMPRADLPLYALVQKGTTNSDKVSWIERTIASETHNTAYVLENDLIPTSDGLWTKVETAVTKIADSLPVTNEMLEDVDFVRGEIMSMLTYNIPHYRETQILGGSGSAQLNGINTMAQSFSLPTGANTVASPNNIDVLRAAILQVMLGYNGTDAFTKGFTPDAIILNPVDVHFAS